MTPLPVIRLDAREDGRFAAFCTLDDGAKLRAEGDWMGSTVTLAICEDACEPYRLLCVITLGCTIAEPCELQASLRGALKYWRVHPDELETERALLRTLPYQEA